MINIGNFGHGHVFERPDGVKAQCGGPMICQTCAKDAAAMYGPMREERDHWKEKAEQIKEPIDMVLFCPNCGHDHIDKSNPPHLSHLCVNCGYIWRPADVPTNGVVSIKTKGKDDSPNRFRFPLVNDPTEAVLVTLRRKYNVGSDRSLAMAQAKQIERFEATLQSFVGPTPTSSATAAPAASDPAGDAAHRALRRFYGVSSDAALIDAQARQIERLQAREKARGIPEPEPGAVPRTPREG